MENQASQYLKEQLGEELSYKVSSEKESRNEATIDGINNSVENLFKKVVENAPKEIQQELADLYADKGNAVDVLKESGIEVTLNVEKQPSIDPVDKSAETEKYQELVSDFKDASEKLTEDATPKQMQEFYNKAIELKEKTEFMLDNNVLGKDGEQYLAESLSNFKYLETDIKETCKESGIELDTRSTSEKIEDLQNEIYKALEEEKDKSFYGSNKYEITPYNSEECYDASAIMQTFNEYVDELNKGTANDYADFSHYFQLNKLEDFDSYRWDKETEIFEQIMEDFKDSKRYEELVNEYGTDMVEKEVRNIENEDVVVVLDDINFSVEVNPIDFIDKDYQMNIILADKMDGREGTGGEIKALFDNYNEYHVDTDNVEEVSDTLNNSMTYLLQQQGYKVDEVLNESHSQFLETEGDFGLQNDEFIQSVITEIEEASKYSQVTTLVTLGGEELMEMLNAVAHKDETKAIEVSDGATIGLFDGKFYGAGGSMEIETYEPFVFTVDMIDYVQLEGAERNENHGYSVDGVYGMSTHAWDGEAKLVDVDDTLKQKIESAKTISAETVENVIDEINDFKDKIQEQDIER
jgi:hypothetical protein